VSDLTMQIAEGLIDIGAVGFTPHTPITFKSGIQSPIYVDNRTVPYHWRVWQLVIHGFAQMIEARGIQFDVIAGIETAGIPHSAALAYHLRMPSVFVRKEAKDHGAKKRVEGGEVRGKQVLLIEDHISTGGSSLAGVQALRAEGAIVEYCLAITSYAFSEATTQFSEAGVSLHVLATLPDLLAAARKKALFGDAEMAVLEDWVSDPRGWAVRQGIEKSS
jgi:orotate phosphoribosyltransferase